MTLIPSIAHNFSSFLFSYIRLLLIRSSGESLLLMNFATSPHYRPLDTVGKECTQACESVPSLSLYHSLGSQTGQTVPDDHEAGSGKPPLPQQQQPHPRVCVVTTTAAAAARWLLIPFCFLSRSSHLKGKLIHTLQQDLEPKRKHAQEKRACLLRLKS